MASGEELPDASNHKTNGPKKRRHSGEARETRKPSFCFRPPRILILCRSAVSISFYSIQIESGPEDRVHGTTAFSIK